MISCSIWQGINRKISPFGSLFPFNNSVLPTSPFISRLIGCQKMSVYRSRFLGRITNLQTTPFHWQTDHEIQIDFPFTLLWIIITTIKIVSIFFMGVLSLSSLQSFLKRSSREKSGSIAQSNEYPKWKEMGTFPPLPGGRNRRRPLKEKVEIVQTHPWNFFLSLWQKTHLEKLLFLLLRAHIHVWEKKVMNEWEQEGSP